MRSEARIERLTKQIADLLPSWSLAPVVEAIQAMRGVAFIVAVTVAAKVGDFSRFDNPRQLMAYLGLTPSEHSRMLSRKVVEGEERFAIFRQAIGGLVVFRPVLGKETIEGLSGIVAALGHPDFLEMRLGSGLNGFRELVEDVHRFMDPTSLVSGGTELLLQRFPEAESAVADRELGRDRQTAAFQIGQKLGPGLGALTKASLKADQFLPAFGRGAD